MRGRLPGSGVLPHLSGLGVDAHSPEHRPARTLFSSHPVISPPPARPYAPLPFSPFLDARLPGRPPPAGRAIRLPPGPLRPLPRAGSPGAPHPHRRSRSSSPPWRGRLPSSRRCRRARTARPRRTTRTLMGTEWPPTAPPWLRERGQERGKERCGAGEREGKANNPAAASPKPLRSSCSADRLRQTD